ncbi:MAG: hypothetical protein E7649_03535 [Ruminococcaceae bacterium]|nr:hypothetical protein [Oscillospiraceae bacterium]
MLNYSIMSLDEGHIDEFCADIEYQIKNNIATAPLFSMTLTPEGDPVIDKAAMYCEVYKKYKAKLDEKGLPSGVLIQASIGHGSRKLDRPSALPKYIALVSGSEREICCPYGEEFRKYIKKAAATIAAAGPAHIMLDDDFRLMAREQRGCACPMHMKRFNELSGENFTREQLYAAMQKEDEAADRYKKIFIKTQIESLVECAKEIRAGIDSVDPTIPGSSCLCGNSAEGAYEIASIMAGEGNPVTIRVNNGNYFVTDHRDFTHIMYRAASQIKALGKKPDIILAETDTYPQNRYSTSAAMLHAHFVFTILEGASGAKQWITRLCTDVADYEPKSGVAYRKKLAANAGFYGSLVELNKQLTYLGCKIPVSPRPAYVLTPADAEATSNGWHCRVLDRYGVPMHFSSDGEGVYFFDSAADKNFTDEELLDILAGKVVLDAKAAERFIQRGFGKYLGVELKQRQAGAKNASGEIMYPKGLCRSQYLVREIVPLCEDVKRYSDVYHLRDGKYKDIMFPGVTSYKNELGGTVVVFSGESSFGYGVLSPLGFFNESRKNQIVQILRDLDCLPVYYPDDAEVLMKAARMQDGGLACVLLDMSLDPIEDLPLVIDRDVKDIKRLMPDGSYADVSFKRDGDLYTLNLTAQVFDPIVILIH